MTISVRLGFCGQNPFIILPSFFGVYVFWLSDFTIILCMGFCTKRGCRRTMEMRREDWEIKWGINERIRSTWLGKVLISVFVSLFIYAFAGCLPLHVLICVYVYVSVCTAYPYFQIHVFVNIWMHASINVNLYVCIYVGCIFVL